MLGFHRRTRSLIPVKDLGKYDLVSLEEEDEEQYEGGELIEVCGASDATNKSRSRQLMLVYLVFFAEAVMASSLQPQLQMLLSSSDYCGNLSSSYLRSILDCAYAFGGTTGLFWGYMADRVGRRRVTLLGLWSMLICCLCTGFATSLGACAIFRFFAGMVSSTIVCTTLTMIGDLSITAEQRAKNVARLPLISLCGSVGPLFQRMVSESLQAYGMVWQTFPILGSELACASVLFAIALTASIMLKETLPLPSLSLHSNSSSESIDIDCEKAAFLTRSSEDTNITLVDFVRPDPITITQFLQAPSLLVLLSSFSLLSLHASTFDVLLPHLGQSSTKQGGMGISCDWLSIVILIVRGIAAVVIFYVIPRAMDKYGLLKLYRSVSLLFPTIYIATPLLALLAACTGFVPVLSVFSILVKHLLTGGASVLVALLVLNTTPDAFSAGTVVGMMQVANLFKAFAVAVSGASYYFSGDLSVQTTNLALWTCLALFGAVGAGLAWFVNERPSVAKDFPNEVLCWETCFDADAEKMGMDDI
ncbi:MFS general substrate transporter [Dothidotthia symphoricarpi CBS 119687]|uniref:MFS general substrate transporter n=1 Tax=Dothidotthia symphoricarpi CBS 119687 TaxID=1392245 RepID=A0A6A6ANT7_9PLEO|nr:MFS general substrate transporter [Dothidotthia symphoricarpi CBS 119687]KAF2132604.1 MFS general substrate transporter [Dothidotthia symphoricarpi CBS 119687]